MFNPPFFTVVAALQARDRRIESRRWGVFVKGKLVKKCGSRSAAYEWVDNNLEDDADVEVKDCLKYGWDC